MHSVNQAINILDSKLEKDICKNEPYKLTANIEVAGKCGKGGSSTNNSSTKTGLNALWDTTSTDANAGGGYEKTSTDKMGDHTSATISKDTAAPSTKLPYVN